MKSTTPKSTKKRQMKKAAKSRLSGFAIQSESPKNKKIVFDDPDGEDDHVGGEIDDIDTNEGVNNEGSGSDVDEIQNKTKDDGNIRGEESEDDAVEEVKGSAARESTQRLLDAERKVAKESSRTKKRRTKKGEKSRNIEEGRGQSDDEGDSSHDEDDQNKNDDDFLTDDFFKMVDSERANHLQKAKQEKKQRKLDANKKLGKHTTFVVEDEHKLIDVPKKLNQNIEVVAVGENGSEGDSYFDRQHILSATLGSAPSKAAIAFARGNLTSGTPKERGSESRKRKSKNEETWKRSRKMKCSGIGFRPGHAARLFSCKK